jgi:pSer/pThr/pTyr-binding forkhead associated (FHA) protein
VLTARDLGSTNGIFLNGARVTEAALKPRDVLRIGDWIGIVANVADDAAFGARADEPIFQEISSGSSIGHP